MKNLDVELDVRFEMQAVTDRETAEEIASLFSDLDFEVTKAGGWSFLDTTVSEDEDDYVEDDDLLLFELSEEDFDDLVELLQNE